MILKQEIAQFQKALELELDAHDQMLNQWDDLDWHDRYVRIDYQLHRMWALYDKADELSGYIRNNFPPYPFSEINDIKRWLKQALHRLEDFMKDDYMPTGAEDYQNEYVKWLAVICDDKQREAWQNREAYIADKEQELLMMLQKSYSVILEMLLTTSQSIKNDPNVIQLSYANTLARYEQLQWNKDQLAFDIRIANRYPWDEGPTAKQLQDFYSALSDELIQTSCGKAYIHHQNNIGKFVQAIAKQQPNEEELLAFFRRTHELEYLQQRIHTLEVQEKQAIAKSIELRHTTNSGKKIIPKKSPHFLETATFKYRYLNTPDGNRRLSLLYQYLTKEYRETKSYIAPDTTPDEFYSLFNGETNNNVITWTGSKQDLYYFIKRMVERSIIDIPDNLTIWTITQNHFSDRRGNIFLDLRNQHNPKISAEAIERLIDILDPAARTSADLMDLSKKVGASFGGK